MLVEQVNLDDERRDMTDGRFHAATYNLVLGKIIKEI